MSTPERTVSDLRRARREFMIAEAREASLEELADRLALTSVEAEKLIELEASNTSVVGWNPVRLHPDADPGCPRCHGHGKVDVGNGIVNPLCPCVREHRRRDAAAEMLAILLPKGTEQMRLDGYKTAGADGREIAQNELALRSARNFVLHFDTAREEGWVLGFYGPPGSGKTHLAFGIGAEICLERSGPDGRAFRPAFLNVAKLLQAERAKFNRNPNEPVPIGAIELARQADIVILDDIGAAYEKVGDNKGPTWVQEQLYILMDDCVMNATPVVYTMNMTPAQFEDLMGAEGAVNADLADLGRARVSSRLRRKEIEGSPIEVPIVDGANRQNPNAAALIFGVPSSTDV